MADARDPRVDPQPGDTLVNKPYYCTVLARTGLLVAFRDIFRTRVEWCELSQWVKEFADSDVIEKAKEEGR